MIQRVLRNDSRILTFSTARASERWYCLVTFLFFLAWFPCYPLFLFSGQEKTFLQYLVLTASLVFMTVLFGWGAMDCATTPYDEQISFDRALKRVRISTKRMYGSSDDEFRFDQVRAVTVNQGLNLELLTDRGKIEFPTGLDDKDADYDPEDRRHAEAYARMARRAIGLPQGDLPSAPIVRAASSSDEASPQSPGNASRQGYCSSRVIRDDTEVLAWQDQDWTLPCLSIGCIVCPMMFHGSWQRTAELLAICTAASLSVMCCYVH